MPKGHYIPIEPGQRFGRLVVVRPGPVVKRYRNYLCLCDCGQETLVRSSRLNGGTTRSCGCYRSEVAVERASVIAGRYLTKHDMTRTAEYRTWQHMKGRCYTPTDAKYPDYGARGIKVCDQWVDDFQAFYEHVGPKPSPRHSIDRIDNDGNYEPGNVRWATHTEQARNRRPAHMWRKSK